MPAGTKSTGGRSTFHTLPNVLTCFRTLYMDSKRPPPLIATNLTVDTTLLLWSTFYPPLKPRHEANHHNPRSAKKYTTALLTITILWCHLSQMELIQKSWSLRTTGTSSQSNSGKLVNSIARRFHLPSLMTWMTPINLAQGNTAT